MNKTELIAAVAKGGKIQLVGFGTFEVSERAAREGRNPKTGETMPIAASKTPKFKAGHLKFLRERQEREETRRQARLCLSQLPRHQSLRLEKL